VNLFSELDVGVDLVRQSHWPDEGFKCAAERFRQSLGETADQR
jgi:hypothetical protein